MAIMQAKTHWEGIYSTKAATEVSWFQERSHVSLDLIRRTGIGNRGAIIDVGGGASRLVDDLLAEGYQDLTVLDISPSALSLAKHRLGADSRTIRWLEADITSVALPQQRFDVWHDRAVFHFLADEMDRSHYIQTVRNSVRPGGHIIVAAFGPDGPLKCSGLPVVRYSPARLHGEFGTDFELVEHTSEDHRTPFGTVQQFVYCYCRLF
jgi:SAM-dependent methyltransferase